MSTTNARDIGGGARGLASARTLVAGLLAVALLAPAAMGRSHDARDTSPRHSGEDFTWGGRIAAGKAIEVKGVNGEITIEPSTGDQVEVVARKSARKSDPDEVKIEVIEHEDGVTLCAVYPTPEGEKPNECKPGEGGRMNTRNNDVQVDFEVRVPARVRAIGRTVNGSISAHGLTADAEAYTVNGSIHIATRGVAAASTVNGSIEAELGTSPREPLEFQTVNGGIKVTLPGDTGAELRASTVNGDIDSELPVTSYRRLSHRRLTGTIGKGGPQLRLTTVNGDIRLRASS